MDRIIIVQRRDFIIDGPPPAAPLVVFADGAKVYPCVVLPSDVKKMKPRRSALGGQVASLKEVLVDNVLDLTRRSFSAAKLGLAVITYKLASGEEAYAVACRPGTTVASAC